MKIGSNQKPASYHPMESTVESETTAATKSTAKNKSIDMVKNGRADNWAADGKMSMSEVKSSESQKKAVFDWALTEEE